MQDKNVANRPIAEKIKLKLSQSAAVELARRHYKYYCELVHNGHWKAYAPHLALCEKMEQIIAGQCKRLIIEMPPRHGKSNTVSETFPSYYIGKFPDRKVIITSKDEGLAMRFGRLNLIKVKEYGSRLWGIEPSKAQASKTLWGIEQRLGTVLSAPIMGGITGNGAHLMIIDDPVKNREQADSIAQREKLWSEWQDTLSTRLEKDAAVIVIMTRWHEDDLAGRLIAQGGWEVLRLPALAEDGDMLGREPDEPLCPELGFDRQWAENKRKEVGSRTWNALYQQRPTGAEGGIFKREWFKRYDRLPDVIDEWTQSWDLTFKDSKTSDYVVGGVWARSGANHYLVGMIRERLDFVNTIKAIRRLTDSYPQATLKLIEEKANGAAVISALRNSIGGIVPIVPKESKEARASAVTPLFESGNVHLPLGELGDTVIEELSGFPTAAHDDIVDMTSQYLSRHIRNKRASRIGTVNWL